MLLINVSGKSQNVDTEGFWKIFFHFQPKPKEELLKYNIHS